MHAATHALLRKSLLLPRAPPGVNTLFLDLETGASTCAAAAFAASHAAPSIGFESACRTPVARNRILNEERQERGQHFLDVAVQAAPGWALGGGHSPTCNMAGKK
ncbi:hypothetical protein KC365_g96 [Hortaea werneckii]|nr:hypothetical protein KC365_g96 [Hortaea werneckii]